MNKIVFLALLLLSNYGIAQFSQKIGIGTNYVALDLPDDLVYIPHINYERTFKKRVFLSTQIGYMKYNGVDAFFNKIPQVRSRFTYDNNVKFAVLKYKSNYLKIGVGVSLWHRNDKIINQIRITSNAPDFIPQILGYNTQIIKDWNLGYNFSSELEISLSKRISSVGSFSIASFKNAGVNSILGVSVFYKFQNK